MGRTLAYIRPLLVEEQRLVSMGAWGTVAIVVAGPAVPVGIVFWRVVVVGSHGEWIWLPLVLVGMVVPGCVLFSRVVTVVEAGQLRISAFVGPMRVWKRVIALGTVRGCAVAEPGEGVAERPGWKLRKFRGVALLKFVGGDVYVMVRGGKRAVVVTSGGVAGVVLGSERPEELVEAIRAGMGGE